ncbi:MAG TPA: TatD family nuclease-associated radical SAM protein, partial [Candidatus Krumholzibacterium sp.]|nr:TatD family nuclease-associated radical SAM protein [Candidatus Krumholzibacterium sp.]
GGPEEAEQVISMGFLIGIGGPLTYRTSRLPEVAERLPSSSFVLETDCPYLPPQQYRGKRNEPSYIPLIAESLARIRGVSTGDIERAAETNFRGLMHGRSSISASVAYGLKNSIYLNVTASCTNDCSFCTRFRSNNYLYGYNLNLDHEPSATEMVSAAREMIAAGRRDVSGGRRDATGAYDSIVFCGYGEPTARLKAVKEAAGELKKTGLPLRLNTNGHGSIINGRNIVPELEESFSSVSISLNAPDAATYMEICRPDLGAKAFPAVVDFIKAVAASRMECIVTALDYPDVDLVATRRLVESIPGASFRVRKYHYPGVAG